MFSTSAVYKLIRYLVNNTTNISNDVYYKRIKNYMFRPIPAIVRISSERVLVFIGFMGLCNDGEISSSVVLIITTIKRRGWGGCSVMWVLC